MDQGSHPALSPDYNLTVARLYSAGMVWPLILLHSRTTSWAFDPEGKPVDDPETTFTAAATLGLHEVDDPFTEVPEPTLDSWRVAIPTAEGHPGQLHGPNGIVIEPLANDWKTFVAWLMAVTFVDNRCRLLIVAGAGFNEHAGDIYMTALQDAAARRRIVGATIPVEF